MIPAIPPNPTAEDYILLAQTINPHNQPLTVESAEKRPWL